MFEKPNTTPFPDELIDIHLKNLSGSEYKILSVIIRKTFGFHKAWDFISLRQIESLTGLERSAIVIGTSKLEKEEFIKSAYVCPKCNLIVDYKRPEKRKGKHDLSCPSCNTKESPNKWYALNITGQDMEQYLAETLKIKQNDPTRGGVKIRPPQQAEVVLKSDHLGGVKIRPPQQPEVVLKSDHLGGVKIRPPRDFKKKDPKANDSNGLHENKSQGGGLILTPTINNTINNAQKTDRSQNYVHGPVHENEKKDFKSESESDLKSQEKSKEQKNHAQGKKLIEEFYPFYFANQMGGPMNSEKNKLVERIGESYESDPVTTKSLLADVAKNLERPSNFLAWAVERIDKKKKNVIEPGLEEYERRKQEESDPETVKKAFSNIFAMLNEKDKESKE